jgi:DtxR family Mn-dependent transcriptional regulator
MYLLTISRALEEGHEGPLGLAALAERLGVSSASANEMIRKMADRDLVAYEPYKGASLTSAGSAIARRVLRTRRLWARFLADHLGFTPAEADEMACDLEHVTSSGAAERLADYLGHPEV